MQPKWVHSKYNETQHTRPPNVCKTHGLSAQVTALPGVASYMSLPSPGVCGAHTEKVVAGKGQTYILIITCLPSLSQCLQWLVGVTLIIQAQQLCMPSSQKSQLLPNVIS
jgi:hypothetical protein